MSDDRKLLVGERGLPEYFLYWGKAQAEEDSEQKWHPLVYHCIDVAVVAERILMTREGARRCATDLLKLGIDDVLQLIPALVVLHDIGKCADFFQSMEPDFSRWGPGIPSRIRCNHVEAGDSLWENSLRESLAPQLYAHRGSDISPLLGAVFGHHGEPVVGGNLPSPERLISADGAIDEVTLMAGDMVALFMDSPIQEKLRREDLRRASWWLAGLINLSDWIGSNTNWFRYRSPEHTMAEYLNLARALSVTAVREAGIEGARPGEKPHLSRILSEDQNPTPAQHWAESVQFSENGSLLFILEDVTGSGKTEAAQMIVHRLIHSGRAFGAYWGLPTQATANAMYTRQKHVIECYFDKAGPTPSLVLAHGQSQLDSAFRSSILGSDRHDLRKEISEDSIPSSSVTCAEYLAHDKRRALLAELGVGTIDQALLSVLPVRYSAMRLIGLADKVLVLDEVHAYDAYMAEEISRLLQFVSATGGHVVLLSATLPIEQRGKFECAWTGRKSEDLTELEMGYPAAAMVSSAGGIDRRKIKASQWSVRNTPVSFVRSEQGALDCLLECARRGGASVWIRNTVDSCLAAAELVRQAGYTPIVFHARFAFGDRKRIEEEVLRLVGKESTSSDRKGVILIATQVVEQSLDLDFDVMVTDLAPIDLLIQRAGRLWRHRRSDRVAGIDERLVVYSPEGINEDVLRWAESLPKHTKWVYNVDILWRTERVLSEIGEIAAPSMIRELIERVYSSRESEPVPDELRNIEDESFAARMGQKAIAKQKLLSIEEGYCRTINWDDESEARTRLGENPVTLRLAKRDVSGSIVPWFGDIDQSAWRSAEVDVRHSHVHPKSVSDGLSAGELAKVTASWGRYDKDCILVLLTEAGGEWHCDLRSPSGELKRLRYSADLGVSFA